MEVSAPAPGSYPQAEGATTMTSAAPVLDMVPLGELGAPAHDRRLGDKILAAFNHAYAMGERPIASVLIEALIKAESRMLEDGLERRGDSVLAQADAWVAFVDSRNAYNALSTRDGAEPGVAEAAFLRMKQAYRLWSES